MKTIFLFAFIFLMPVCGLSQASTFKRDSVYCIVSQMPSFPGGENKMMKFIQKNVRYPYYEKQHNITGTVHVTFVVDTLGNIKNIKVGKGISNGPGLEYEAMKVVKAMPKWVPGKQDGLTMNVMCDFPLKFSLQNSHGR